MSTIKQGEPAPRVMPRDLEARSSASQALITQFAVAGVMLSGFLTGTTAVPPAVPISAQTRALTGRVLWTGNGLIVDDLGWFGLGAGSVPQPVGALTVLRASTADALVKTSAVLVGRLRNTSGLTWDQLARLFGVSRRALHLWASGGRMNAANYERLAHLLQAVDALPGFTPAQRRAALLAPGARGMSLFDQLRAEHASSDNDISGTPWGPSDLLRGSQEPEET